MGEVGDVHQPEDQREADREQAVEQPHQQSAGKALDDGRGGHEVILSVRRPRESGDP